MDEQTQGQGVVWSELLDAALTGTVVIVAARALARISLRVPGSEAIWWTLAHAGIFVWIVLTVTSSWRIVGEIRHRFSAVQLAALAAVSLAAGAAIAKASDPSLEWSPWNWSRIWTLAATEEVVFRLLLPAAFSRVIFHTAGATNRGRPAVFGFVLAQVVFSFSHTHASRAESELVYRLLVFDTGIFLSVLACGSLVSAVGMHTGINLLIAFGGRWQSQPSLPTALVCGAAGLIVLSLRCRRPVGLGAGRTSGDRRGPEGLA